MKTKRIPQRKCIGCQAVKDKRALIRIVRPQEGKVQVDLSGRMSGRGAYLCPDGQCLQKAVRSKALERSLSVAIDASDYAELQTDLQSAVAVRKEAEPDGK